ncbi:MAG: cytochrome c3 family protein [Verrucomicrobiales bacterium]|nr:cytochrome c3 family protein [Verrucomicrobiales bacterium]
MGNFFPRWTNWLPLKLAVALVFIAGGVSVGVAYYFTPKYTRVGYEPSQPIPFSHKIHAGQLGLDCRYCHSHVESSGPANVPTNETCFNCHGAGKGNIRSDSPKLAKVMQAQASGHPIEWERVHKLPDYAYFNHSVHVNRGVSCASCHGKINEMTVVRHEKPLSMGWCLDCHRTPEKNLRPLDQITNLDYQPSDLNRKDFYASLLAGGASKEGIAQVITGEEELAYQPSGLDDLVSMAEKEFGKDVTQKEVGTQLKKHWQVQPPESCAACHR